MAEYGVVFQGRGHFPGRRIRRGADESVHEPPPCRAPRPAIMESGHGRDFKSRPERPGTAKGSWLSIAALLAERADSMTAVLRATPCAFNPAPGPVISWGQAPGRRRKARSRASCCRCPFRRTQRNGIRRPRRGRPCPLPLKRLRRIERASWPSIGDIGRARRNLALHKVRVLFNAPPATPTSTAVSRMLLGGA